MIDDVACKLRHDMGLRGKPAESRVVVAMSGGVDSSVVAGLLKYAGYEVVGITLQLYNQADAFGWVGAKVGHDARAKVRSCCAGRDLHDAQRAAAHLEIPHYVLDFEKEFRHEVIDDFADSYLAGETPVPCVRCNQTVKFADLFARARSVGAAALATGHYVRSVARPMTCHRDLLTPVDMERDQSYFLFATTQAQVDFLRFPLGDLGKAQVRKIAGELGLAVADKPDSQDICFVPTGRYDKVIAQLRPGACVPGDIVDLEGRWLGRHDGIMHFTVGQRRGLGLSAGQAGGQPLYVVRLDAQRRQVIVGPQDALLRDRLRLRDVNWLGPTAGTKEMNRLCVKIRSTGPAVPASVTLSGKDGVVALDSPVAGIAPGQACVFYSEVGSGAKILGGGFIASTSPNGRIERRGESSQYGPIGRDSSEELSV